MDQLVQQDLPVRKVLHQLLQVLLDTQVLQAQWDLQVHKVHKVTLEQQDQLELPVHKEILDLQVHKV
jgi:hypothetical protein